MSNLAKVSKQALQYEHDRQFDKALAIYAKLFDEAAAAGDEVDVALLNRAGDVAMRLGDAPRAVGYFERAIDAYAAGGLLNNAIAVCNKLLRQAPEHAATHYTLAVLHAKQGFRGDAKHHFVEYAERMHRAGRDDEALRALSEFAALCPAGDDVREALAKHLAKGNRGTEIGAKLEAMLPEPSRATDAASAPSSSRVPTPASAAVALVDERGSSLVFLDVSLDAVVPDVSAVVAPLAGLEPTASAPEPADLDMPSFDAEPIDLEPAAPVALDESWGGEVLPMLDDDLNAPLGAVELMELDTLDAPSFELPSFELPSADVSAASVSSAEMMPFELETPIGEPSSDVSVELPLVELGDDALASAELSLGGLDVLDVEAVDVPADVPSVSFDADATLDAFDTDVALDVAMYDAAEPVATEEPYWEAELPGELPALSLNAWIGSAAVGIADAPLAVVPATEPEIETPAPRTADQFVDLGDWLRGEEPVRTTRLTTEDVTPTGDEAADFERMLGVFKAGIARNVGAEDHASHYDLGVAFREMGLIDEAIGEFQRAARDPRGALRAREALGGCFLDRGSPDLAAGVLERALDDATAGEANVNELSLLGVVYLLGEAYARLGQHKPARACFQRVVTADIEFRDAARRLMQLPALTP